MHTPIITMAVIKGVLYLVTVLGFRYRLLWRVIGQLLTHSTSYDSYPLIILSRTVMKRVVHPIGRPVGQLNVSYTLN